MATARDLRTSPARTLELGDSIMAAAQALKSANADDDEHAVVNALSQNQIRRLPILDGDEIVGIISQADVARHLSNQQTGDVVEAISRD